LIKERLGNNKTRAGAKRLFALYDTSGEGFDKKNIFILKFYRFLEIKTCCKRIR
jgi:hypothetical protein